MNQQLRREVGLLGAIMLGLGSIVGTGVFVSLGIGASIAGDGLLLALGLAAVLAAFNGLSSAQLAAAHPVSGGTYEYANRTLGPLSGFTAGWMYLTAKSASAATAALGFASYLLHLLQMPSQWLIPTALAMTLATMLIVLAGARRTNIINTIAMSLTLGILTLLIVMALPDASAGPSLSFGDVVPSNLFEATALMFVAYTGYGRIATLGEEVINPKKTIPKAIVATLCVVLALYVSVAAVSIKALGSATLAEVTLATGAPLEAVAQATGVPWLRSVVIVGAASAMFGVMLNLLLGLSRVLLAMGRRKDMPSIFASVNASGTTPVPAVLAMTGFISLLILVGNIKTTWSFSAFTVLIYYALTNLSALRLPEEDRLFGAWISVMGLLGCAFLALWVPPTYWLAGGGLLAVGHVIRVLVQRLQQ